MTTRDPAPASILAARIMRAYGTLSPYSAALLAEELCRIERAQHRHAERCCNGEEGGYVRIRAAVASESARSYSNGIGYLREHDPEAEERAGKRIDAMLLRWRARIGELLMYAAGEDAEYASSVERINRAHTFVELQGDPRGHVLLVRFPGETEASWC